MVTGGVECGLHNSRNGSVIHWLDECAMSTDFSEITKLLNTGSITHICVFSIFIPCLYYKM